MTSRESLKSQIDNGFPVLPRFSMAANPDAAAGSPIVAAIDRPVRRGLLQTWQRPAIPEFTRIETIIGEEIHDALTGAKSDTRALAAAERRIKQHTGLLTQMCAQPCWRPDCPIAPGQAAARRRLR